MEEYKLFDILFNCGGTIQFFQRFTRFPSIECVCVAGKPNDRLGEIVAAGSTFTSAVDKAYDELQVRIAADRAKEPEHIKQWRIRNGFK